MSYFPPSGKLARLVHFIDECEDEADLRESASRLRSENIWIAYVDCGKYINQPEELIDGIGYSAQLHHPPYKEYEHGSTKWVKWWDDLSCLGETSTGLIVVLDNAHLIFDEHRKVMTDVLHWFLVAADRWVKRDSPYTICFQMVPCPALRKAICS